MCRHKPGAASVCVCVCVCVWCVCAVGKVVIEFGSMKWECWSAIIAGLARSHGVSVAFFQLTAVQKVGLEFMDDIAARIPRAEVADIAKMVGRHQSLNALGRLPCCRPRGALCLIRQTAAARATKHAFPASACR